LVLVVMIGKGRGGGINALEPVIALVPIPRVGAPMLATRDGMIKRSTTFSLSLSLALFAFAPPVEIALLIALGGLLARGAPNAATAPEPEIDSRWRCRSSVGRKPSPCWRSDEKCLSKDRNPEERSASRSSSWKKCGAVRYVVRRVKVPRRCGTGGKVCVSVGRGR
jgi:hypothetical protein